MKKLFVQINLTLTLLFAVCCLAAAQAGDLTIGQKNKTFIFDNKPVEALTIKQGDTIHFMNNDPWFHNIFSLAEVKTFDLGSYPKGESRPVIFDQKGRYEIECAIHPNMFLEVFVE